MQNKIEVKEAFETIRNFCKSRVDGCSKCLFCGRIRIYDGYTIGCKLLVNYPCNWEDLDTD